MPPASARRPNRLTAPGALRRGGKRRDVTRSGGRASPQVRGLRLIPPHQAFFSAMICSTVEGVAGMYLSAERIAAANRAIQETFEQTSVAWQAIPHWDT